VQIDVKRPLWIAALDASIGRTADQRSSAREGPESEPKSPFHWEREITFAAVFGVCKYAFSDRWMELDQKRV
jgi:hypothetical protein